MGIHEEYAKQGEAKNPPAPSTEVHPKKNKSLKEIRANTKEFDLFGEYLGKEGKHHLGEKMLAGEIDANTRAELDEEKENFLVLMEQADEVLKNLDTETIKKLAEATPEFKSIVGMHGADNIKKALKSELSRLAISDPSHFDDLSDSITKRITLEKEREEEARTITEAFKEYGITSDKDIAEIMHGGGDISKIAKKIAEKKEKEALGWFSKKFDIKPSKDNLKDTQDKIEKEIRDLATKKSGDIKSSLAKLNAAMNEIGLALEASIMEDPNKTLNNALTADFRGENIDEYKPGMDFAEATENMRADLTAKARWEARLKERLERPKHEAFEKWLVARQEDEARLAWEQHLDEFLTTNSIERQNLPQAEYDRLFKNFSENYKASPIDDAAKSELYKEFSAEYDAVALDPALFQNEREALQNEFVEEEVTRRMTGKKKGFWSDVSKEFFKKGLFDLFS